MKIKGEFIMREIMDEIILVPIGRSAIDYNGLISLDPVGAFIWKLLEQGESEEEILQGILEEFDVSREMAEKDMRIFLQELTTQGLLDND